MALRDYRHHEFQVGDAVFFPFAGKLTVAKVEVRNDDCIIEMVNENGFTISLMNDQINFLSFTPYIVPSNWKRPPVELKTGDKCLFWNQGGSEIASGHLECIEGASGSKYKCTENGTYYDNCEPYSALKAQELLRKLIIK